MSIPGRSTYKVGCWLNCRTDKSCDTLLFPCFPCSLLLFGSCISCLLWFLKCFFLSVSQPPTPRRRGVIYYLQDWGNLLLCFLLHLGPLNSSLQPEGGLWWTTPHLHLHLSCLHQVRLPRWLPILLLSQQDINLGSQGGVKLLFLFSFHQVYVLPTFAGTQFTIKVSVIL